MKFKTSKIKTTTNQQYITKIFIIQKFVKYFKKFNSYLKPKIYINLLFLNKKYLNTLFFKY